MLVHISGLLAQVHRNSFWQAGLVDFQAVDGPDDCDAGVAGLCTGVALALVRRRRHGSLHVRRAAMEYPGTGP